MASARSLELTQMHSDSIKEHRDHSDISWVKLETLDIRNWLLLLLPQLLTTIFIAHTRMPFSVCKIESIQKQNKQSEFINSRK